MAFRLVFPFLPRIAAGLFTGVAECGHDPLEFVEGIVAQGEKVVVFKFKRRKNYLRQNGHRQAFTEVEKLSLYNAAVFHPPVLYYTPVAVRLAIFPPGLGAEEHTSILSLSLLL